MARIIIETDEQEYGALAKRKPDPPPAPPLPQNPAWVQHYEDHGYATTTSAAPSPRQVRAEVEANRQLFNYGIIAATCLLLVTGFNSCTSYFENRGANEYRRQLLEHKGLLGD